MSNFGHWTAYPRKLDPENAIGFVYMIVDLETHRKYIGKKLFKGLGKKNKGQTSNWRSYTSSSKWLTEQIRERGKRRFRFIIIEQYYTLGGLSFGEVWSQITLKTPLRNDEFINRYVDRITFKVTEEVSERHQKRLRDWVRKYPYPKKGD
jgi:hypothetical protein